MFFTLVLRLFKKVYFLKSTFGACVNLSFSRRNAFFSSEGAHRQVLLPVLEAQEILSRQLALSEDGRPLEEGDVDECDPLGPSGVSDLLRHHLADERNRNPAEPVDHFLRATDPRSGEHGAVGGCSLWDVLARFRDELGQTEGDVIRDPRLDPLPGRLRVELALLELPAQLLEQEFEPGQTRLKAGESLIKDLRVHGEILK